MKTNRRDVLKVIGSFPIMGPMVAGAAGAQTHQHPTPAVRPAASVPAFKPKSLTAHQFRTVRVLADLIIPADQKSGSASDAGVPEFIDEVLSVRRGSLESQILGGLAWLDHEANRRFEHAFADCASAQQHEILDLIAWTSKASPEYSHAVAFFSRFRDLVAGGFYSSKMGIQDLGYLGNTAFDWKGCPEEACKALGVKNNPES